MTNWNKETCDKLYEKIVKKMTEHKCTVEYDQLFLHNLRLKLNDNEILILDIETGFLFKRTHQKCVSLGNLEQDASVNLVYYKDRNTPDCSGEMSGQRLIKNMQELLTQI